MLDIFCDKLYSVFSIQFLKNNRFFYIDRNKKGYTLVLPSLDLFYKTNFDKVHYY